MAQHQGVADTGYEGNKQSPQPNPSFSPFVSLTLPSTSFSMMTSLNGSEMTVARQLPSEIFLSYSKQMSEISKMSAEKQKELIESISKEMDENYEKKDIDKLADDVLENAEEFETVLCEIDGIVQSIITRIETKGGIKYFTSQLVTKYVGPAADAAERMEKLREDLDSAAKSGSAGGKIISDLDEIGNLLEKIGAKESIIAESLEKIRKNERVAMPEARKIAALSELEDLLERDAKEIGGNALKDGREEREERISRAREVIDILVESLEKAKKRIGDLIKDNKTEVPQDFYDEKLADLLKSFPDRIQDYIKARSKDRTLTPRQLKDELDRIIDFIRSDRVIRALEKESVKSDGTGEIVRKEIENVLEEISNFMKSREKLDRSIKDGNSRGVIDALEEMKKAARTKGMAKRLSEFKERMIQLVDERKKMEQWMPRSANEEKEKELRLKGISERTAELCNEMLKFLDNAAPFFSIIKAIRVSNVNTPKSAKMQLDEISSLLEDLRDLTGLAIRTKSEKIPAFEYLNAKLKDLRIARKRLPKDRYEDLLRKEMAAFQSLYPHLKKQHLFDPKEGSVEDLENWIVNIFLEIDPKKELKDLLLEITMKILEDNMRRELRRKQEIADYLKNLLMQNKMEGRFFTFFVNRLEFYNPNMVQELVFLRRKGLIIKFEHGRDFYDKKLSLFETAIRLQSEEFKAAVNIYISLLRKFKEKKAKGGAISEGTIGFLMEGATELLKKGGKTLEAYDKLEYIASKENKRLNIADAIRNMSEDSMLLFCLLGECASKEQILPILIAFDDFVASISLAIIDDVQNLRTTIDIMLNQCKEKKCEYSSYTYGLKLYNDGDYKAAIDHWNYLEKNEGLYTFWDAVDGYYIMDMDNIKMYKVLAYEKLGSMDAALQELRSIQLTEYSSPRIADFKITKMLILSATINQKERKKILNEVIQLCNTEIKRIKSFFGFHNDSCIKKFSLLKETAKRKLKEL